MRVFAIGDLHLSFKENIIPGEWQKAEEYKPMNIFGEKWEKHYYKIYKNWSSIVEEDDLVLVPGDISWAATIEEFQPDLDYISKLPGQKVFIKGNHDYWWQRIGQLRSIFPENCNLLQNDSIRISNIGIAGSRGWVVPNDNFYSEKDEKIFNRELIRLQLSLDSLDKDTDLKIAMFHYMPVNENHQHNQFIELLERYNIDLCIYGHLHGEEAHSHRLEGYNWGIDFRLVSADFLNFFPAKLI